MIYIIIKQYSYFKIYSLIAFQNLQQVNTDKI